MKNRKGISVLLLAVFMMLFGIYVYSSDLAAEETTTTDTTPSGAVEAVNPNAQTTVNFSVAHNGVTLKIYKIADISDTCRLTAVAPFNAAPFDQVTGLKSENINDLVQTDDSKNARSASNLAYTLSTLIEENKTTPTKTVELGDAKAAQVTDLGTGMFLAIPERTLEDDETDERYIYMPNLFFLPSELSDDGTYNYTANVTVKAVPDDNPYKDPLMVKIVKIWDDDEDSAGKRPTSIKVHLLEDGEQYETIELKEDNGWTYQKEGLDAEKKWTVVEDEDSIPDGYSYEMEEIQKDNEAIYTYTITNTYNPPDNPPPTTTTTPPPTTSTTTKGSKLPQTGQLWWPVPILCIGGFFCIVIGRTKKYRADKNQ